MYFFAYISFSKAVKCEVTDLEEEICDALQASVEMSRPLAQP